VTALHGLAENPALPPELLDRLIALADRDLNWHLSRRSDLSAEQRLRVTTRHTASCGCGETPDPDVLPAERPDLPPVELFRLTTHENPLVRSALAVRRDLPRQACERLAADPIPGVRRDLAGNPSVPEAVLRSLAADSYQETRRALAHNPAVPLDLLADPAATARVGPTLVPRVATATADELRLLAGSAVPNVRMLVAQREDLPPDVLDRLAADPEPAVAKAIAVIPALTAGQLWAVVHRHGTPVYPRAALNPNCPPGPAAPPGGARPGRAPDVPRGGQAPRRFRGHAAAVPARRARSGRRPPPEPAGGRAPRPARLPRDSRSGSGQPVAAGQRDGETAQSHHLTRFVCSLRTSYPLAA
jgi:hypothetical protein